MNKPHEKSGILKKLQNIATWIVIFTLIGLLAYVMFMIHWILFSVLFCIYLLYVLNIDNKK